MCVACNTIQVNAVVNRYDPTRSTMLRNAFVSDSNRRFNKLAVAVREAVQTKDVLGLGIQNNEKLKTPSKNAYAHMTPREKVEHFLNWIEEKYMETILATSRLFAINKAAWTDKYDADAYKRGVILARSEMKKLGYTLSNQNIDNVLASYSHKRMLSEIAADTYNGYRTIASSLNAHMTKIITDGFINGLTPKQMADRLIAIINGSPVGHSEVVGLVGKFVPAKLRGEIHARTAITKSHHLASVQEYENFGLTEVTVIAEFTSMKDGKVCSVCATLDGQTFTLEEIRTIIPVHARCRCFAKPKKLTI